MHVEPQIFAIAAKLNKLAPTPKLNLTSRV